MSAVHMLFAALALPPLLYLPGWALSRRLGASADPLERHYERVAAGALWSGWLALLLASLGLFSLWLHLLVTLGACLALVLPDMGRRRRDEGRRTKDESPAAASSATSRAGAANAPPSSIVNSRWSRWEAFAHAAILLVALLLVARPFETVLGVRDAGVYANTGFAIARTGGLVQADPLLAQWGAEALSPEPAVAEPAKQAIANYTIGQPRDRYIATRLRAAGFFVYEGELPDGRVIPQGLHLLPAWIGLLTAMGGPYLGLFAPGLLGVLGVWSVGMLGRRLAGPLVGALAMALLALNGTQIWFGRYSTAETVAQFLIFAGLYFFARAFGDEGRRTKDESPQGATITAQPAQVAPARPSSVVYRLSSALARPSSAALAGVAIGQVALARLDFFLLGPVLAYLLYMWLTRRWDIRHTALALGLGAMLLHAGLHIAVIARAYFFDTGHDRLYRDYALLALASLPFLTPAVRATFLTGPNSALVRPVNLPGLPPEQDPGPWLRIVVELGALLVALVALFALRARPGPLFALEGWLASRRGPALSIVAAGVLLLGGYAYLVRPAIVDADLLFNTRGGWNDPLTRDPAMVARDVREGRMSLDEARNSAGVALDADPLWAATPDLAATAALRERLAAERGPWAGPFSNQTTNWLRVQGYVGAPVRLPLRFWTNEYGETDWRGIQALDLATLSSPPAPINDKYTIPLANLVRVGWYLSPLGVILGIAGYALWWRRGLTAGSWLFLAVAFVGTFFYVRQTYGTSDQHYIYILRRFVPIAYPAFSLCIAYALAALADQKVRLGHSLPATPARLSRWLSGYRPSSFVLRLASAALATLLLFFLAWTNRPIIAHTEYAGAIEQLRGAAAQFEPGRDVLLMRGGAPIYAEARDVPDLVATPLRFGYGLDAFAVKSTQPGSYADDLAAAARAWRAQGREVYLLHSASGGSFALPGFALEQTGGFTLDVPEFEQLTDQKPRNVARLTLPFAVYRLVPTDADRVATVPPPLGSADFAAQVNGLYRPELGADGTSYAWTNGDATLRLPWPAGAAPVELRLALAGGLRPAHLGPARVCLSALPETSLWPTTLGTPVELGCSEVGQEMAEVVVRLDPAALPPAPSGTLLLRLDSVPWTPAAEDPRQTDRRAVGVQLGGVWIDGVAAAP